ncbi:MAG: cohesin domain-containing protein [Candidatus Methanoperedens sp.]|nr:cohesin domain-containing protein [Candidatus Methanoperedens sp.]
MNKINISTANLKLAAIVILSILAALLLIKIFFIPGNEVGPVSPVEISVDPVSHEAEKGKEFTIYISVDPANNPITAAQFSLLFNSSLIEIKNVTEGSLLKQKGAKALFGPGAINNSKGTLTNTWGVITTPRANITEKGTFAVITLVAKNTGKGELRLSGVILSDFEGTMINARTINGSVNIK